LISTLAAYYDVHTKNSFQSLFGDLDIGKNPTSWANKHLVLILDLSTVEMGNLTKMEDSFNKEINAGLTFFLEKYAEDLGTPDISKIIDERATVSFLKTFVSF